MAALDPNSIVTVQVNTILAPAAPGLQQRGAILSFGGTNTPVGTASYLTQFEDLAPILSEPMSIVDAVWTNGTMNVRTTDPLPASTGGVGTGIRVLMSGFLPAGINGQFDATVTGVDEFSYPQPINPGLTTQVGTVQLAAAADLNAQVSTFYRQGNASGVYVLEMGFHTSFGNELLTFENFLNTNTLAYYGYLLPYSWGAAANIPSLITLFQQFTNPEAMIYFWLTLNPDAGAGLIPKTLKCVIQLMEAPSVKGVRDAALPGEYAEFTMAGVFYWGIQFRATAVTRVAPMCFKYIYGVTPYPVQNNSPLLVSFKQNAINYIQVGAEGGINYTNVYQGVTADGQDYFNWWWTIDWVQINANVALSNAIINGANNPLAPLYYDQFGINFLEAVLAGVMTTGVQLGMVNGTVLQTGYDPVTLSLQIQNGTFAGRCNVNAVPFLTYAAQNPDDYGAGEYDGLSTLFVPARGFVHILVVVVATNIVTM
jgi:hypothetical protein